MRPATSILRLIFRILTFAVWALTIAAGYAGKVSPVLWAWPSVLVLLFPYLLAATVIAGVGWLVARSYITAAVSLAVLLAVSPAAVDAWPVRTSGTPHNARNTFSLMTYNVYGGIDIENPEAKISRTLGYIISRRPDIVCMQEYPWFRDDKVATEAQIDSLRKIYPVIIFTPEARQTILSRYPVERGTVVVRPRGNIVNYHLLIKGHRVDICSLHLASYALNEEERNVVDEIGGSHPRKVLRGLEHTVRDKLLSGFRNRVLDASIARENIDSLTQNLIVCGDFNDVPASWAYRVIRDGDLRDAISENHFGPMITYNAHNFYFRLDHILCRGNLRAFDVERGDLRSSDHYPLTAKFEITNEKN